MTLQENDQAARLQPFRELSELRSDPAFPLHASQAKGQPPQALLPGGREGPDQLVREAEGGGAKRREDEHRSLRPRRRHRFAVPIAAVIAASGALALTLRKVTLGGAVHMGHGAAGDRVFSRTEGAPGGSTRCTAAAI